MRAGSVVLLRMYLYSSNSSSTSDPIELACDLLIWIKGFALKNAALTLGPETQTAVQVLQ